MEWELLYMCNLIGCIIILLIFIYHFIGADEDSKAEKISHENIKETPIKTKEGRKVKIDKNDDE